jgi:hypothetical protein
MSSDKYTSVVADMSDDKIIENLEGIIEAIKSDTFTGIVVYSDASDKKGFLRSNKGLVNDRVILCDMVIKEMISKQASVSIDNFYDQLYPMFKYMFGDRFLQEYGNDNRSVYVV